MHFLYRGILAPPASKVIGALLLGIGLVYFQLTRERHNGGHATSRNRRR